MHSLQLLTIALGLCGFRAKPGNDPPGPPATFSIPTGSPFNDGVCYSFEFSTTLLYRIGMWQQREEGIGWEWSHFGPSGEWISRRVAEDDFTRTTSRTTMTPGGQSRTVERKEWYLTNCTSACRDLWKCNGGTFLKAELLYFPFEGIAITLGFDTQTLDIYTGLRMWF